MDLFITKNMSRGEIICTENTPLRYIVLIKYGLIDTYFNKSQGEIKAMIDSIKQNIPSIAKTEFSRFRIDPMNFVDDIMKKKLYKIFSLNGPDVIGISEFYYGWNNFATARVASETATIILIKKDNLESIYKKEVKRFGERLRKYADLKLETFYKRIVNLLNFEMMKIEKSTIKKNNDLLRNKVYTKLFDSADAYFGSQLKNQILSPKQESPVRDMSNECTSKKYAAYNTRCYEGNKEEKQMSSLGNYNTNTTGVYSYKDNHVNSAGSEVHNTIEKENSPAKRNNDSLLKIYRSNNRYESISPDNKKLLAKCASCSDLNSSFEKQIIQNIKVNFSALREYNTRLNIVKGKVPIKAINGMSQILSKSIIPHSVSQSSILNKLPIPGKMLPPVKVSKNYQGTNTQEHPNNKTNLPPIKQYNRNTNNALIQLGLNTNNTMKIEYDKQDDSVSDSYYISKGSIYSQKIYPKRNFMNLSNKLVDANKSSFFMAKKYKEDKED